MQILSPAIDGAIASSSWIRRMFEAGIEMKRVHGADNVYDFSLGNPDLPPPRTVQEALQAIAADLDRPMALGQRLMAAALGSGVDVNIYRERRDAMARVLDGAGIQYTLPQGAFYFFPKVPHGTDDKAFVDLLLKNRVLGVPGSGFGYPGFFRLTFCVDQRVIERSAEGFRKAAEAARATA